MLTPEKCVKFIQSKQWRHQDVIDVVQVSLLLTLNRFTDRSHVSIAGFKQVNAANSIKRPHYLIGLLSL